MLENLNEKQLEAVTWSDSHLLVLAGAGTGKTRVLTTRIAYILSKQWAQPWQIMAVTFTNKAANEMKKRIATMVDNSFYTQDIWCGTFHSLCLRILRANSHRIGLRSDFLIFGEVEQKAVIKSVLATIGGSTKKPEEYVEEFSRKKDTGIFIANDTDNIYNAYNKELARLNAIDFGDIILKVLQLFEECPDVLERYQKQFKYVLVDEFQDINNSQMKFLKYIVPPKKENGQNIFCVGDEDQSIYSWRGAEIKHILDFEKTYGNAKIIIDANYRSTANILGAANSLIRHNKERIRTDKRLEPANPDNYGQPVYVLTVPTDRDEARVVADAILRRDGAENYSGYAILIRAGALSRLFEEEFATRNIPYRLVGTTKFYDRAEIRDAIAYLRLLVYPFDDLSFIRVIAKPRRGFGDVAIAKLRASGDNLMSGLKNANLSPKLRAVGNEFLGAFDFDWESMRPVDAAECLLENSGYMKMWRESTETDAPERLDHIRELITNVISKYDTLPEFLEHASLMMTDDNDDDSQNTDAVSIMTIHAAKGLEFDTVFMPAWEDGIFPNDKTINEGALEEERRLAYVAITRARRVAIISNAMSRMVFGEIKYNSPSRFITEMDGKYLDFQGGAPRPAYQTPTSYAAPRQNRVLPMRRATATQSVVGKLCEHADMGRGVAIEENGDIVTVAFRTHGIKKVARQYLKIIG